jgi:hypothetical protein
LLEVIDIGDHIALPIILGLLDFASAIGELVLLCDGGVGYAVLDGPLGGDGLLGFDSVVNRDDGGGLDSFPILDFLPAFGIVHQSIKSAAPFLLENWLEKGLLGRHVDHPVFPKVLKDVMGMDGSNFAVED